MIENVLQYAKARSQKVKVLQSFKESSTTYGPEGTVSNKCFKSLEILKTSLSFIKVNIPELTLFPEYKMRLNMEVLLM